MEDNASKCSHNGCNNFPFKELDKCALHCEKKNYSGGRHSHLLNAFYQQLCDYLADQLFNDQPHLISNIAKEDLRVFCNNIDLEDEVIINTFEKIELFFCGVSFPEQEFFDYLKLIRLFKSCHFNKCSFYSRRLKLVDTECFFDECRFYESWDLFDYKVLENVAGVTYQACIFEKDVEIYTPDSGRSKLSKNQFDFDCEFKAKLYLNAAHIEGQLFSSKQPVDNYSLKVECLELSDVVFTQKLILNNIVAKEINFKDVSVNSKYELKCCKVDDFKIYNTNFELVADFYKSRFSQFSIQKSVFEKFVGFELCEFGDGSTSTSGHVAIFKHTTFFDFLSFRSAVFFSGVQLEEANFKFPANFYACRIEDKLTSRETLRIIKHAFDSVGNKLEANSYYSRELKKYKEELYNLREISKRTKTDKKWRWMLCQDRFVFWVNEKGSNFGQDLFRPIIFLALAMLLFMLLSFAHEENYLYRIIPEFNIYFECISTGFNSFAKAYIPFSALQKQGMEFLSLLFGLFFSIFTWLAITAIKMRTRR